MKPCPCHAKNRGHFFSEALKCRGCRKSWEAQQKKPSRCPHPWRPNDPTGALAAGSP